MYNCSLFFSFGEASVFSLTYYCPSNTSYFRTRNSCFSWLSELSGWLFKLGLVIHGSLTHVCTAFCWGAEMNHGGLWEG